MFAGISAMHMKSSLNNNGNWNLYSAFFMPNVIKRALQFDKMITSK